MGSERRRGSVRPRYKAGILGMAMLPPSPSLLSPVSQSLLPSAGLHEEGLERVPASLSTKRAREQHRQARDRGAALHTREGQKKIPPLIPRSHTFRPLIGVV